MARVDVKMLLPLFRAVDAAAKQAGESPGRWIALHLAGHFVIEESEAVPSRKQQGRPRKAVAEEEAVTS